MPIPKDDVLLDGEADKNHESKVTNRPISSWFFNLLIWF